LEPHSFQATETFGLIQNQRFDFSKEVPMKLRIGCVMVGFLSLVLPMAAQTAGSSPASAQVPPLVNFSGVLADVNGKPLTGVVGVTFSLYQEQQGGSPLWLETQNVQAGKTGNYTVALGSTSTQGLPANVFASRTLPPPGWPPACLLSEGFAFVFALAVAGA
jgi:hypothetical protein